MRRSASPAAVARAPCTATNKVANRRVRDSGCEIAHRAVTRRPPISLYTMVPRTRGCMYAAKVWNLSIVQVPFSVAPCQSLALRFATLASLYEVELRVRVERLAANCPPPHHVPREQPSHGGRRTPERRRTLEARSVSPPLTPWCCVASSCVLYPIVP